MGLKILYPVINGEITGGNIICLQIIEESLKNGYGVVINSPTDGKFTHLLREKGLKVYNIDTHRTFRLDSALKLACIIKKEKVKLIHSHTPLPGVILSRLAGRITGVPVINHSHMPYFINLNFIVRRCQLLLNWVTSRFFCFKVIAVCESVKKEITRQKTALNKIMVVYNGFDLDNIQCGNSPVKIREQFSLKENQPIIGQVGRLGEDKGQHILIKAARIVIKDYPDAVFMIVGEDLSKQGKYAIALENLVSKLGLKKNVIFTGYRVDILDLMNTFDVFVLPSTFMEGIPLVILEAMAAKKPVISTYVGGNPEIVVDGLTGTLVPAQDVNKLATAIIYHLKNHEISKQMGQEGYKRIQQYFSAKQMTDKVMAIYKQAIGEK